MSFVMFPLLDTMRELSLHVRLFHTNEQGSSDSFCARCPAKTVPLERDIKKGPPYYAPVLRILSDPGRGGRSAGFV